MKGICFKEPLFNAIIERRKTQTRRIIDNKNYPFVKDGCFIDKYRDGFAVKKQIGSNPDRFEVIQAFYPKYKVGEMIYLKEPYIITGNTFEYRFLHKNRTDINCIEKNGGYKNKLFMPASAARYFIKITDVRYERLQGISDEDCIQEGIKIRLIDPAKAFKDIREYDNGYYIFETPEGAFAALFDKIHGKGTWDSNPFVWVYDFELIYIEEIQYENKTKE